MSTAREFVLTLSCRDQAGIVYADDALLVVDKPAGLLCVPGRADLAFDALSLRAQRLRSFCCAPDPTR